MVQERINQSAYTHQNHHMNWFAQIRHNADSKVGDRYYGYPLYEQIVGAEMLSKQSAFGVQLRFFG